MTKIKNKNGFGKNVIIRLDRLIRKTLLCAPSEIRRGNLLVFLFSVKHSLRAIFLSLSLSFYQMSIVVFLSFLIKLLLVTSKERHRPNRSYTRGE